MSFLHRILKRPLKPNQVVRNDGMIATIVEDTPRMLIVKVYEKDGWVTFYNYDRQYGTKRINHFLSI